MRLVVFFRSSLFIAFVSLLVLTGYGFDVLDYCCENDGRELVSSEKNLANKSSPVKKSECQCICHQIFAARFAEPVRSVPFTSLETEFAASSDEFPPDSMPLGIDYPPQLA